MLKQKLREDVLYLIKIAVVYLVLLLLVFVVASPVGGVLQEREALMASKDETIPLAMLEFVGIQKLGQFPAKVEVFFLGILILNLIFVVGTFAHGVSAMRESYEKSRFSFFFMQIMPLWKNYILVLGEILIVSLLSWGIYTMEIGIVGKVLTSDLYADETSLVSALLEYMSARGIALVLFITALGMLFGMLQSRRIHGVDIGLGIVGVSFVLGNLYKIPQYIGYTQVQAMVNAQKTMETMRALKSLRIVCPFSWLNPVNIYNGILESNQLWIYLVLAVLLFIVGGLWYCRRDWLEV